MYNNFDGTGLNFADYEIGSVEQDLDYLLDHRERIKPLGEFFYKITSQFFDADKLNQKLYELYEILILGQQIDSNK